MHNIPTYPSIEKLKVVAAVEWVDKVKCSMNNVAINNFLLRGKAMATDIAISDK